MNQSLLIIEDNLDLMQIYQDCLKRLNLKIVCAGNGEEGLKKFLKFRPNFVLCDLKMPKLSGFEVIEIINDHHLRTKTEIIILSAYGDHKMRNRAQKLGIKKNHYLIKSQITLKELVQTICQALQPMTNQAYSH